MDEAALIGRYRRAVAFLESLPQLEPGRPRSRGGPDAGRRALDLLHRLGDPQRGPRFLHVGGTSGKGSVVSHLHRVYHRAGYPVLSFTSPHLTTTAERLAFAGGLVPLDVFADAVDALKPAIADAHLKSPWGAPGYFDALFAVCLLCARRLGADPVIVEVGLGGSLDATNQLEGPLVTAVTDVGLDHTEILGDTLALIAQDKGGIYKAGAQALTSAQAPEAWQTLAARAAQAGAPFARLGEGFDLREIPGGGWRFEDAEGEMALGPSPLTPDHRRRNVALAVAIARAARRRGLPLTDAQIAAAADASFLPGRFEWVDGRPPLLLDVAHNPDKLGAFVEGLVALRRTRGARGGATALFALAKDKDLAACLAALSPAVSRLVVSRPLSAFKAFWSPKEIAAAAAGRFDTIVVTVDPDDGLERALALEGKEGLVAVTGSTYLVGDVRARLQPEEAVLAAGGLSPLRWG